MKNGVAFSLLHYSVQKAISLGGKVNFAHPAALITCSIFTTGLFSPLSAQTPSVISPTGEPRRVVDYSLAINELIKLGFPDIKNAKGIKYVKVNDQQLEWNSRGFSFGSSNYSPKNIKGNGFLIPNEDPKKPSRFIYLGGYEMQHLASSKKGFLGGNSGINDGNITKGAITDTDIKQDLKNLTQWVKDFTSNDSFSYSHNKPYTAALGYASVAHQAGYKKEATALIKALFLNHQNPEQMIDTLINLLAEKEYLTTYKNFQSTSDWEAYRKDLLKLQEKYPRGWKNQPGLSILIPLIDEKINPEINFKIPEIKGHTFSPEILAILKQIPVPPKKNQYFDTQLFLINKAEKNRSSPAFAQLTQHGMEGFIAITALIGDKTLVTPSNMQRGSSYHHSYSSYSSSNNEISPEDAYSNLQKPQTIGSIAQGIISSNLPHDQNELRELDAEGYKQLATEWWKEHRDDTRSELIQHYMAMGNSSHTYQLINSLMNDNSEEANQLLEKSILTSEEPSNHFSSVQIYIKKHKTEVNDFANKYIAAVENELTINGEGYLSYELNEPKKRKKVFAELLSYTREIDPIKLLKTLAEDDESLKQTTELLISAYDDKHLSAYINPIINVVVNKEDPKHQIEILNALLYNLYSRDDIAVEDAPRSKGFFSKLLSGHKKAKAKEEAAKQTFTLTPEQKTNWTKLVTSNVYHNGISVSALSGYLLDLSAHPKISHYDYQELHVLGKNTVQEIISSRSEAILNHTEVPPLPNAKNVSEQRREEILANLEKTEALKIREAFYELSYSERISVTYHERLRQVFSKADKYILGFDYPEPTNKPENTEEIETALKNILGMERSPETYLKLSQVMIQNADTLGEITMNIKRNPIAPGREIQLVNSSLILTPETEAAQKELLDGKIESFTILETFAPHSRKNKTSVLTANTKADAKELTEIADNDVLSFTAINKTSLNKLIQQQKNAVGGREALMQELLAIPGMENNLEMFEELPDEQLQTFVDQFKKSMGN